ncbi:MAG: rubredoxin [Desulfobacterales bacterium]|nr:rubredoxin [Desulfobacterales bacterium]
MKKWQCSVCKYVHTGEEPPEKCPVCGVASDKFVLLEEDTEPDTIEAEPVAEASKSDDSQEASSAPSGTDTPGAAFIEKFGPAAVHMEKAAQLMVKHHAHPMSVHLPNGVIPIVAILVILAWFSGSQLLLQAGFINLVFVLISLPIVGLTGVLEWQRKYNQAQTKVFKIKIAAASVAAICCIISIIWYLVNPEVLGSSGAWLFVFINVLMLAGAGVAGHIGGKLVFKE